MRLLQYKQELFDYGYTVSSSTQHYECKEGGEHLPIKVTRLNYSAPLDFAEDLAECIKGSDSSNITGLGSKKERLQRYVDILSGKNPQGWSVSSFQITADGIYLDIYNEHTGKMDWFSLERTEYGIELHFDVPHPDSKDRPDTKYEVYLPDRNDASSYVQVVEWIHGAKREIQFFHKSPESDEQFIEVTEYADL